MTAQINEREQFDQIVKLILQNRSLVETPNEIERQESISETFEYKQNKLRSIYEHFIEVEHFALGDIVLWKESMKNKRFPLYGQPSVVMEILDSPIINSETSTDSAYYGEPLDVRLGFMNEDGNFVTFLFDSRRFTHSPI